jgi:rhamnosyltransferase
MIRSTSGYQNDTVADPRQLVVLTVTYHPDIKLLTRQLENLPPDSSLVIVDNASNKDELQQLEQFVYTRPRTWLIRNETNRGLATALNQAATYAFDHIPESRYLLLLDQDSVPQSGAVEELLRTYVYMQSNDARIACIGPRLDDASTGLQHGFHCTKGGRWVRAYPTSLDRKPIACTNLNGSGTLMRADIFQTLGGLEESFFIDHVDTEWSFRALAKGYFLYGIPWIAFEHSMGERGLRFWLCGWRVWPQRSAKRHYFLFRNALWLMRRSYVPFVWKFWAAVKLILTLAVHAITDPKRGEQVRCMISGLHDGLIRKK